MLLSPGRAVVSLEPIREALHPSECGFTELGTIVGGDYTRDNDVALLLESVHPRGIGHICDC